MSEILLRFAFIGLVISVIAFILVDESLTESLSRKISGMRVHIDLTIQQISISDWNQTFLCWKEMEWTNSITIPYQIVYAVCLALQGLEGKKKLKKLIAINQLKQDSRRNHSFYYAKAHIYLDPQEGTIAIYNRVRYPKEFRVDLSQFKCIGNHKQIYRLIEALVWAVTDMKRFEQEFREEIATYYQYIEQVRTSLLNDTGRYLKEIEYEWGSSLRHGE
jgi:hypothetical protein